MPLNSYPYENSQSQTTSLYL